MARLALLIAIASLPLPGAILPQQWREHKQTRVEPVVIADADKDLWTEYQGDAAEKARYNGPIGPFSVTAWRLSDSTSALAWFQQIRPANCIPARDSITLCTTPGAQVMAHQNYVLQFEGWRPLDKELTDLYAALPGTRSGGGLPKLPAFLPEKNRVRNSERYILGVQSLSRFEPRITPESVGFEDAAEAQFVLYKTPAGDVALTLFHYPNPQLAKKYQAALERQPGVAVRRNGSLVAVIPGAQDAKILAPIFDSIVYDLNFTWNEATKPPPMPDVAGMLISIFELTGLLLVICVGGGLLFAGLTIYLRRRQGRLTGDENPMTFIRI